MHRALLTFTLLVTACSAMPERVDAPPPVASTQITTLRVGEVVRLASGARARYTGVGADSRCQPGVQCVWAGDLEVVFLLEGDGSPRQLALHTGREPRMAAVPGGHLVLRKANAASPPVVEIELRH